MRWHFQFEVLCSVVSVPCAVCVTWSYPSVASFPVPYKLEQTIAEVLTTAEVNFTIGQNQPTTPVNPQIEPQQSTPQDNRFLQPPLTPAPVTPDSPPLVPAPVPETTPPTPSVNIPVRKIEVTGSTLLSPAEINSIIQPLEGRTVTLEELRGATQAITQLYLNRGYINSRAILVDQAIADGLVQIRVIEGKLERIEIEGTRRLNRNYIRSRILLGAGTPLNIAKLEDQLRLLRSDPLFENVEASLRSGSGIGQSILIVRVQEADPFDAIFSIDNYSPPSVGSERLGIFLRYRNLSGIGDEIFATYYRTTTGGADNLDFIYRVPLNAMNGTLQLRVVPQWNRVTQAPFDALDIRGESQLYEISYRQPLIRSSQQEFALSVGFSYQDGQTFTFAGPTPFGFGPDDEGVSRTSVFKFGQDYLRRDSTGAWSLRSQFNFGTGLFNATENPSPIPDAHFFSWLGQIQRVQVFNNNNYLIISADVQLTPDPLLPSQQFIIGGGQSVRGYRQNVRAGDNGVRFSIEDRITLQRNSAGVATFQLAPFFDLGTVWNVDDNPNSLQRQRFLAGIGLGLLWEPIPNLNIRVDYGFPIINLDDRGENAQDHGFYFSVNYRI